MYFNIFQAAVKLMRTKGETREMIASIWAESIPYWATASNTAILNLKQGDQVWLEQRHTAPYLHGYMYSTFSGHTLFREQDNDEDVSDGEVEDTEK